MAKRRAHGEGTIVQLDNGSWRGAVSIGAGKRKWVRGSTRGEVVRMLTEIKAKRDQGLPVSDAREKLGPFLDQWLEHSVRPSVRPRTYDAYESHVRRHLKPVIGKISLADLSPMHVQHLLNDVHATGLSATTVHRIHATLRRALNQAVRWGLVTRNVAKLVDLPKLEQPEIEPLKPDEARALLDAVAEDRLEGLYSVSLAMGLRQGEALGLRWQDIDLERRQLRVRHQLQRHPRGNNVIQLDENRGLVPTKTHRSRRALLIPETLVAKMKAHRARQARERLLAGDKWHEYDLVFTTGKGTPLDAPRETRRFQQILEEAGLPRRRFHDLRHSCGTILAAQGVPVSDIMAILGHAQLSTTMRYVHSIPETQRMAAKKMDDALWGDDSSSNIVS